VPNQLDRALQRNPGYPPGCSPRDVDRQPSESRRWLLTAVAQRRGEEEMAIQTADFLARHSRNRIHKTEGFVGSNGPINLPAGSVSERENADSGAAAPEPPPGG
jgi:hypothetical protein